MLAALDQENLVHGHQQAAASKPLNQTTRQLAPKTPGNKPPKTPFKVPLNDENGLGALGGGKTGAKVNGRGDENLTIVGKKGGLGDKDAFKTPMGPRNRAPLGLKTTNAKTKAYHIPTPASVEDVPDKSPQKSASTRKSRPRVSHAQMTKLDILGDLDELGEREIEYMPPPPKSLPDYPDDIHELNLVPFPNGDGLWPAIERSVRNTPDSDGLSYNDREEMKRKEEEEIRDKEYMAQAIMDTEISVATCPHEPECPKGNCNYTLEATKKAEAKYQKTIEELHPDRKPKAVKPSGTVSASSKLASKKPITSKGPSTLSSKTAATTLSQPGNLKSSKPTVKPSIPPPKSRLPFSNISSRKRTPPPTNPSAMRHTAATVASKTTIGRSAGRSVSASIRQTSAPGRTTKAAAEQPDTSLPPGQYIERYGEPKWGGDMWFKCRNAGCFDEDQEDAFGGIGEPVFDDFLREEAEREFAFDI
ncbi:MAG: hypothetical protein Q9195_001804 [Heterodermia aff. obscurata]